MIFLRRAQRYLPGAWGAVFSVSVSFMLASSLIHAQGRQGPNLPPGVQRPSELPASGSVPPNVFIDALDVDWTESSLRATLQVPRGMGERRPSWQELASDHPEALILQLSVPAPDGRGLTLAVHQMDREVSTRSSGPVSVEHPAPVAPSGGLSSNRVHVGGIAPWTFTGPDTQAQPGWNSALAGEFAVDVRWLGTSDQWILQPPPVAFTDRLLISSLNPLTGQGSFFLVRNRTGRPLPLAALTGWIRDAVSGQHLIAVHADGPDVEIGQGNWRMGDPGGSGERSRAGAVLILEGRGRDDLKDLARDGDVQLSASSYEFAYPASQAVSGRLWPVALRPPVWMARKPGERSRESDWFDLELGESQPVEAIRLVHVGAAGWSSHFNPGKLRIELRSGREVEPLHEFALHPESSVTLLRFAEPFPLRGLRLHFDAPGGSGLPAVAGLMAVQVLGRTPE